MNPTDSEIDSALAALFQDAFPWSDSREDAFLNHFKETLPERLAWAGFRVSMAAAGQQLQQSLRCTLRAAA